MSQIKAFAVSCNLLKAHFHISQDELNDMVPLHVCMIGRLATRFCWLQTRILEASREGRSLNYDAAEMSALGFLIKHSLHTLPKDKNVDEDQEED